MTYSERKRVSSAKYYRNKRLRLQSTEHVREHKRIQMAQKRAEKKAKRRLSDKPTIKSEPTTGIARARARARRRAEAALTIANDVNATQIESRHVSDAERDASESLVLMSKLHTPKPAIRNISPDIFEHWQDSPRVYEGGNSNSADSEEDEMGVRARKGLTLALQHHIRCGGSSPRAWKHVAIFGGDARGPPRGAGTVTQTYMYAGGFGRRRLLQVVAAARFRRFRCQV
ncbi:hypothetical protein DFH08DRAFT_821922 [Mycena albidolilacea]|uniref:Uncharacterized protein n=1 Tax=Mycena albidolilacea TaxID=1033008 RepID=A0AAD6ZAF1_9AGAR|nr:hypothetical protein DFH08DRAFT_821922 [Mycena albidolilacea]